jgi:hypothetical protein
MEIWTNLNAKFSSNMTFDYFAMDSIFGGLNSNQIIYLAIVFYELHFCLVYLSTLVFGGVSCKKINFSYACRIHEVKFHVAY